MNYPANTAHWVTGNLVLHDADAKEPKMVMVVIGYARDGLCKTQYVNRSHRRTIYKNEIRYLHRASYFIPHLRWNNQANDTRLMSNAFQDEWDRVRRWNFYREIGCEIFTTSADGGFIDRTVTDAFIERDGFGYVMLENHGKWALKFVSRRIPSGVVK